MVESSLCSFLFFDLIFGFVARASFEFPLVIRSSINVVGVSYEIVICIQCEFSNEWGLVK